MSNEELKDERAALLDCPFCGSDEITIGSFGSSYVEPQYYVRCEQCDGATVNHTSEGEAAACWNRRAAQPPAAEEIAARAKTVHRRIDALCKAANTPGADYFDASTNMLIATRDLLIALGHPHRMDSAAPASSTAQPPAAEGTKDALTKAAQQYDDFMSQVAGCTDGGCVIRRPVGMHTNGGCRCPKDHAKMQRMAYAANKLRAALSVVLAAPASSASERTAEDAGGDGAVAMIKGADEYGPILEWSKHWVDLIGDKLYTRPAPANKAVGLTDEQRESVCVAIAEALGDALDCTRTWSAWGCGTMRESDFVSVAGDQERVAEIADAAINALLAAAQPSAKGEPQ